MPTPSVQRPGPPALHAPLASAPQLENAGGWRAAPMMVSGADAYVDGEYLYQDFIYDSFGANTTDAPLRPDPVPAAGDSTFGGPTGDVVYPTDAATHAFDSADLLEFRARPVPGGIAYRVTLNTMLVPDAAGFAIGIDSDRNAKTRAIEWGYGIGSLGTLGLEHVLVGWGTGAELDGAPVAASVDVRRNQIEVTVPLAPGTATWRHYLVVGLFDAKERHFREILEEPTETEPGGAHFTDAPPVFNVGFRFDEPMGDAPTELGSRSVSFGNMRDHAQAKALAARDISAFHADISFEKLARRATESHVPATGYISRLYASHLDLGEGAQETRPMFLGKIQPYTAYVPTKSRPGSPAPMHLLLHSLSAAYNQYESISPNMIQELGEQRDSFIMTTAGRGPDGWYSHEAELDLFEAWADIKTRYDIDASRVTVGGYSMGGFGTYKFASQYPDLFAKAFAVVGPPDENVLGGPTAGRVESDQWMGAIADNLRTVPLLMWNSAADELVPIAGVIQYADRIDALGYRYELDVFPLDHFLPGAVDEWDAGREFLGDSRIDYAPSHVTYRAVPSMDDPALGLVHDHAYWLSGITVAPGASSGLVDAVSHVRGAGAPEISPILGAGTEPLPHIRRGIEWTETKSVARNALTLTLEGVRSVTVWPEAAGLDAKGPIDLSISSSTPVDVVLAGRFGGTLLALPAGSTEASVRMIAVEGRPTPAPRPTGGDPLPANGVGTHAIPAGILLIAAAVSRRALRRAQLTSAAAAPGVPR